MQGKNEGTEIKECENKIVFTPSVTYKREKTQTDSPIDKCVPKVLRERGKERVGGGEQRHRERQRASEREREGRGGAGGRWSDDGIRLI